MRYYLPVAGRRALPRVVTTFLALAAAATVGAASAAADPGPTPPNPTSDAQLSGHIRSVNARLDRLDRQLSQLDEQYNVAVNAVAASQRAAARAAQAAQGADEQYRAAHAQFVDVVREQYERGPGATVGTLMTSESPQDYLDGLAISAYLSSRVGETVQDQRAARTEAARATRRADAALATARTNQAALATRRAKLEQESQRFTQLLSTLTDQQRQARARAREVAAAQARATLAAQRRHPVGTGAPTATAPTSSPAPKPAPVSGNVSRKVQRVIAFAEAQVGKSYAYGADGPNSYDCSGLTMAAWRTVGVHLPHSAAEQYGYGTHVSYNDLQPGDLIFLYSPIGHVELYVGDDLAVSAANESTGIVYVHPSQDRGDFAGATRLVG